MDTETTGIKFLYLYTLGNYNINNPGANILSVTDQYPGDYAPVNLTTFPLRETYRTANATGWKEIVIAADDQVTVPDTFAILNHNFTNLVVVELQGSMTNDFTAPAFTLTWTYNEKHMVLLASPGVAYKYYKFRILDPTNTCGFLEIGKIIAGQSFTFSNNEDIADDITIAPQDFDYSMQSEGFLTAYNQRVTVDQLTLDFQKLRGRTMPQGDASNYQGIREMVSEVGTVYPFLTIVDPSDPYFSLIWGQIQTLPQYAFDINRYVSFQITIQETY